jgi:class 3 adenylate cyclase
MTTSDTTLAILFADIAQSTRLYEILGDKAAQNLIGLCLTRLADVATQHGGSVIKTIGDEVMCTFPEARGAVEAARNMHEALEERFPVGEGPGISPNLHVGVHVGPVIRQENDVFGDAVNVAARLVNLSKSRQILISRDIVECLEPRDRASIRNLGRIPVRGKAEDLPIYELVWEEYDMTIIADHALASPSSEVSMEIHLGDRHLRMDASKPVVTMGRDKDCDLVLRGNHVSRSHAKIEYVAGKFFLSDQSSNGTYVSFQGGESVYLRRDKAVLHGTGTISPGVKAGPDGTDTIRFQESC